MTKAQIIRDYALRQVGGPYVYGATAQKCTPAYRRARQAQYKQYAHLIAEMCPVLSGRAASCAGCRYNGKKAFDCAQLTRYAAKAAGLTLVSGSKSQWTKTAWARKGSIQTLPKDEVAFLYRVTAAGVPHTGIYTGDGYVIDARGHRQGVMRTKLSAYKWTHWAQLPGMAGEITPGKEETGMILQNGSQGAEVKALQEQLIKWGHDLGRWGADGKYGAATEKAVREFQQANDLRVTGEWRGEDQAVLDEINKRKPVTPAPPGIDKAALLSELQGLTQRQAAIVKALMEGA